MANKKYKSDFDSEYWRLMNRVAKNVQKIRIKKDFTQEDMLMFGFERRWFQRIESGAHSVSLPTLYRLAIALEVDISDFFK